jgi:molybdate transport system ATP-binding protein
MGSAIASVAAMVEGAGLAVRLRQRRPIPLDATLACGAGELLALVGPSGSGKTTILRCIAGLDRPVEGRVACNGALWLDGAAGVDLPPQRRSVGLVFQAYALFPHLSALDNVAAALGHLPRGARRDRAQELLDLVHLAGLEARRPAELSGGQQQRVALARALAREPAALLLDEPFSAVDQVTRRKLQRELAQLRRRLNMPIVLVTHDLDEARVLADRMTILHHGTTLQDGPPAEVMARPRDPLVARLVDHRNLFEGRIVGHDPATGITRLRWLDHELEAGAHSGFAPGSKVTWVVPPGSVILHRRDRPSRGERENPVAGIVEEVVELGESASVVMAVAGGAARLTFTLPTYVAQRNRVAAGEAVTVSLLGAAIHLMPWTRLAD